MLNSDIWLNNSDIYNRTYFSKTPFYFTYAHTLPLEFYTMSFPRASPDEFCNNINVYVEEGLEPSIQNRAEQTPQTSTHTHGPSNPH